MSKPVVKRNLLIFILISVAAIFGLFFIDIQVWQAARDLLNQESYAIAHLITTKGLFLFYGVFGAVFIYALLKKNAALSALCLAYVKAQLIFSFGLVRILKIVLGRARPEHGFEFTFFSLAFRYNSFPSGHAADAFVSGVFLFYLLKNSKGTAWRFLPLVYASLIAISRVFVSAHYPSDVAAGMVIGTLGAWFFIARLNGQYS